MVLLENTTTVAVPTRLLVAVSSTQPVFPAAILDDLAQLLVRVCLAPATLTAFTPRDRSAATSTLGIARARVMHTCARALNQLTATSAATAGTIVSAFRALKAELGPAVFGASLAQLFTLDQLGSPDGDVNLYRLDATIARACYALNDGLNHAPLPKQEHASDSKHQHADRENKDDSDDDDVDVDDEDDDDGRRSGGDRSIYAEDDEGDVVPDVAVASPVADDAPSGPVAILMDMLGVSKKLAEFTLEK